MLKQLFASVSVNSGRKAARYITTRAHLHFNSANNCYKVVQIWMLISQQKWERRENTISLPKIYFEACKMSRDSYDLYVGELDRNDWLAKRELKSSRFMVIHSPRDSTTGCSSTRTDGLDGPGFHIPTMHWLTNSCLYKLPSRIISSTFVERPAFPRP